MCEIRTSEDFCNRYDEISEFCHNRDEPIYISRDAKVDMVVMSIALYEKLSGKIVSLDKPCAKNEADL